MLSGLPVRVDICRGAGHGDNVVHRETAALDMQTCLVINERVEIELERRAGSVLHCGVPGRHLVCRGIRRDLDCGAGGFDGGGELRRELYHVARLDVARGRSQCETCHGLRHYLDAGTRVGGEQCARGER